MSSQSIGLKAETTVQRPTTLLEAASLSTAQLLELYPHLEVPGPDELVGEHESRLPSETDEAVREFFSAGGAGRWLGKAYGPASANGHDREGYNLWHRDGEIIRNERFAWKIDRSSLDGRPALVMKYSAFRNPSGAGDLIDEVRRIDDGLYLGVYHTRTAVPPFTRVQRGDRSAPEVFLLGAKRGAWRGPDDPAAELLQ